MILIHTETLWNKLKRNYFLTHPSWFESDTLLLFFQSVELKGVFYFSFLHGVLPGALLMLIQTGRFKTYIQARLVGVYLETEAGGSYVPDQSGP